MKCLGSIGILNSRLSTCSCLSVFESLVEGYEDGGKMSEVRNKALILLVFVEGLNLRLFESA
jgi:hypothetical protein